MSIWGAPIIFDASPAPGSYPALFQNLFLCSLFVPQEFQLQHDKSQKNQKICSEKIFVNSIKKSQHTYFGIKTLL